MLLPQFQVNGHRLVDLHGNPLGWMTNWTVDHHRDVRNINVGGNRSVAYAMFGPACIDMHMTAQFDILPPMIEFDEATMSAPEQRAMQHLLRNISFKL